jgi:hypothetical protein
MAIIDGRQTDAERKLEQDLTVAGVLLDSREYVKLEALLSKLALDARSLALLGPEGAQAIPVSHSAAEAWGRSLSKSVTNRVRVSGPTGITREGVTLSTPNGLRQSVGVYWTDGTHEEIEKRFVTWLEDDAPVGAGDSVEADRG